MSFPNKAGDHADTDEILTAELNAAGIRVHNLEALRKNSGEVKAAVLGDLYGWTFKRAWYYWVCTGPGIEAAAAEELHAKHGRTVRVAGHCGCPSPREWFKGLACGSYHVDDAEGLKALADTIRSLVTANKTECGKNGGVMIYIKAKAEKRGTDQQGSGHFGAPRNGRKHNGIDYACEPGSAVFSPVCGVVTKLGYPYADDLSYRYVQVTTDDGMNHRVFYIFPAVHKGDTVGLDSVLGFSQRLNYEGITQHCHYEIKDKSGNYINPENQ